MRTKLQVAADRAAEATLRSVSENLQHLREDAGLTKVTVARVAGIDPTYLAYIERGERTPSLAVVCRIAAALGATAGLRIFPSVGPPIRDRFQARMIEAFLRLLPPEWDRHVEVAVHRCRASLARQRAPLDARPGKRGVHRSRCPQGCATGHRRLTASQGFITPTAR